MCRPSVADPLTVHVIRDVDGITLDYDRACTTDTYYDLADVEALLPGIVKLMEVVPGPARHRD